jgi:hypothetical protein
MFMSEGQVRLGYPLEIYFHRLFVEMLIFEPESTLQMAKDHRLLHLNISCAQ